MGIISTGIYKYGLFLIVYTNIDYFDYEQSFTLSYTRVYDMKRHD